MSEQQAATTTAERTLTGTVVSTKMQKTIAVTVERLVKHDRYGKNDRPGALQKHLGAV